MLPGEILAKVKKIEIKTRRLVDELTAGAYHSVFKGSGVEFEEVREYTDGDDIRSIDWNVTARMNFPYVKQFTEERELTVFLMVDVSASGDFGSTGKSRNEVAAELGALIAFSAIRNRDRVGLMMFTDREELHLPARKGKNHVLRLIRELLFFEPVGKKTDLKFALDNLMQVTKRKSVVFLISDLLDTGFESSLRIAAKKHDLIVIHLIDPLEKKFPAAGSINLEDAETGEVFAFSPGSLQQEIFEKHSAKTVESNLKKCRNAGVDVIQVVNGEDYTIPLMNFFSKRGGRR